MRLADRWQIIMHPIANCAKSLVRNRIVAGRHGISY